MIASRRIRWIQVGRAVARVAALIAVLLAAAVATAYVALPEVDWLATTDPATTRFMAVAGGRRDGWRRLAEISPVMVCAVVKAEDRNFFGHGGIEWSALWRASRRWVHGQPGGGGSTITQQLAKNLFLSPERTARRKLAETLLAVRLERALAKERLLELYLNLVEWGDGVWGIEAAARRHAGTSAAELDALEASVLASLLAAPRRALAGSNLARARSVQKRVLMQLYLSGVVTSAEWSSADARAGDFWQRVASGDAIAVALAKAAPIRRRRLARDIEPTIPRELLLARGCGVARELHETRLHRERRAQERR